DPANIDAIGVYFELWLLRLAGYLPDWSKCDKCDRGFDEMESVSVLHNFHLVCEICRNTAGNPILECAQRHLFQSALRLSPGEFVRFAMSHGKPLKDLSNVLKRIISHSAG